MKESQQKKIEKTINEMNKRFEEEGGANGYFTKLWKKLGDNPMNNLKQFKFKKEVLNAYSQNIPTQRFLIEKRSNIVYLRDKEEIYNLKCSENKGFVYAHLVDLARELPKNQQDWWQDNLIE